MQAPLTGIIAPMNILSDLQLADSLLKAYPGENLDTWELEFDPKIFGSTRDTRNYDLSSMEEDELLALAQRTSSIRQKLL